MDKLDRIYALHGMLRHARRPVPFGRLQEELECCPATVKRTIKTMRYLLDAPIEYHREANGYYYDHHAARPFELPGLWFSASELHALLTAQQLLSEVQPGLLGQRLEPLRRRIDELLANERLLPGPIDGRVRLLRRHGRATDEPRFRTVADALLRRRRLELRYHGRERDAISEREVSPQRLVHYQDHWYLDAWCHVRSALRSFALDRVRAARPLDRAAEEIDEGRLDAHYAAAYGIFGGPSRHTAVLCFTPSAARWVADERWHPAQHGEREADGSYRLELPYGDDRELIREILRWGPEVEVVAPEPLRAKVAGLLGEAAGRYRQGR